MFEGDGRLQHSWYTRLPTCCTRLQQPMLSLYIWQCTTREFKDKQHCCAIIHAIGPPAAVMQAVAEHELNPLDRALLSCPHSMCELRVIVLKTIITAADILLFQYPRLQGVIYAVCCLLILHYSIIMVCDSALVAMPVR